LSYEPQNLQALCPACHTKKTRIECGHSAPIQTPERDAWADAVAELATKTKPKQSGEYDA
jgi:5-methylcytosine-specific restriction enzyme A